MLGQHAQLLGGTGLADARLTGQHDQPSLAGQGVIEGSGKLRQLPLAANENATDVTVGLGGKTKVGREVITFGDCSPRPIKPMIGTDTLFSSSSVLGIGVLES